MKTGAPIRCAFRSTNHSNHPSRKASRNWRQLHGLRTALVTTSTQHTVLARAGVRDHNTLQSQGRAFRFLRFARQRHAQPQVMYPSVRIPPLIRCPGAAPRKESQTREERNARVCASPAVTNC